MRFNRIYSWAVTLTVTLQLRIRENAPPTSCCSSGARGECEQTPNFCMWLNWTRNVAKAWNHERASLGLVFVLLMFRAFCFLLQFLTHQVFVPISKTGIGKTRVFLDREVMGLGICMYREVLDQEGGKRCRMWCCENPARAAALVLLKLAAAEPMEEPRCLQIRVAAPASLAPGQWFP